MKYFLPLLVFLTNEATFNKNSIKNGRSRFNIVVLFGSRQLQPRQGRAFAVSFLTRYLITQELLPLILKSDKKLIFTVASPGHNGTVHFEDVHFDLRKFKPIEVVKQFNKCNDVYTSYLSKK